MNNKKKKPDASLKIKRQHAIFEIIKSERINKHEDIVYRLENQKIYASQSTVSRDLTELKIEKSEQDGCYQFASNALKQMHVTKLQELFENENRLTYYPNVTYQYLKTELGRASVYAYHLQQAFPDVILDVTTGINSLIMLVNKDAFSYKDFSEFLLNKGTEHQ